MNERAGIEIDRRSRHSPNEQHIKSMSKAIYSHYCNTQRGKHLSQRTETTTNHTTKTKRHHEQR